MIGRREFTAAGLSAAALAALAAIEATGLAQDRKAHDGHADMFDKCAEACGDCQRACDSCGHHCATMLAEGKKDHLTSLESCQDCATVCAAAAQIVARQGEFSDLICQSCAEACKRCGEQCEKFPDDKHMTMCAKECRKCEKACRDMLKHANAK